jgi:hypothetical protein
VTKTLEKARITSGSDGGRRFDHSDNVEGEDLVVLVWAEWGHPCECYFLSLGSGSSETQGSVHIAAEAGARSKPALATSQTAVSCPLYGMRWDEMGGR